MSAGSKVNLKPYWSPRHKREAFAITVEGTAKKLFVSREDLAHLKSKIELLTSND